MKENKNNKIMSEEFKVYRTDSERFYITCQKCGKEHVYCENCKYKKQKSTIKLEETLKQMVAYVLGQDGLDKEIVEGYVKTFKMIAQQYADEQVNKTKSKCMEAFLNWLESEDSWITDEDGNKLSSAILDGKNIETVFDNF